MFLANYTIWKKKTQDDSKNGKQLRNMNLWGSVPSAVSSLVLRRSRSLASDLDRLNQALSSQARKLPKSVSSYAESQSKCEFPNTVKSTILPSQPK